jgi:hypothetical protein
MIVNKRPNDPFYYKDWDDFVRKFPQELEFICRKFDKLCKLQRQIIGKNELMNILNNLVPIKFPYLKTNFEREFPEERLDRYLGIGLWNIIESDNNQWEWKDICDQQGVFQTKLYTKI